MDVFDQLIPAPVPIKPRALTIGSFDGVHQGHQSLLHQMRTQAKTTCVLTFSNHPSHILPNRSPAPLITSQPIKLHYLKTYEVDIVYCIPFTMEIANLTYKAFLEKLKALYPFDLLILGEGASLGKNREGTSDKIEALAQELHFTTSYLPKIKTQDQTISSRTIRSYIQNGDLKQAAHLLGHPFMLEGQVISNKLQLPPNLCLPPDGEYIAHLEPEKKRDLYSNQTARSFSRDGLLRKNCL